MMNCRICELCMKSILSDESTNQSIDHQRRPISCWPVNCSITRHKLIRWIWRRREGSSHFVISQGFDKKARWKITISSFFNLSLCCASHDLIWCSVNAHLEFNHRLVHENEANVFKFLSFHYSMQFYLYARKIQNCR